jgi:hypothetical protein
MIHSNPAFGADPTISDVLIMRISVTPLLGVSIRKRRSADNRWGGWLGKGLRRMVEWMDKAKPFPCPKCGRRLMPSGELLAGNVAVPTYQCDECLVMVDLFGQRHEVALTFAVDAQGRAFDPAEPDGRLRF